MLMLCVLPFLALCAYVAGARAQSSAVPTVEEMIERLKARTVSPEELRNHAVIVEGRQERAETAPSLDLDINFEYASARLTPDARIVLDNLGQALTDPVLRDSRIRIAGHTDARGNRDYNLRLSRQRARAVADYLVRVHRIDTRRLAVEGLGFSELLDPAHPESPVNRRVQITNLSS
jgi:outer membrane protein OmpA-like peptidoglycan-associated protein